VIIDAAWQMIGLYHGHVLGRAARHSRGDSARRPRDGASEDQYAYRRIILPMLQPITLSALIVLGHISLKIFDLVYSMTGKGPAFATDMPGHLYVRDNLSGTPLCPGRGHFDRHAVDDRRGDHPLPDLQLPPGGGAYDHTAHGRTKRGETPTPCH